MPPVTAPPTTARPSSRLPTPGSMIALGRSAKNAGWSRTYPIRPPTTAPGTIAEHDEQEVVEPQLHGPRADAREDERDEDRAGDPQRFPADDAVANMQERVEVECDHR